MACKYILKVNWPFSLIPKPQNTHTKVLLLTCSSYMMSARQLVSIRSDSYINDMEFPI